MLRPLPCQGSQTSRTSCESQHKRKQSCTAGQQKLRREGAPTRLVSSQGLNEGLMPNLQGSAVPQQSLLLLGQLGAMSPSRPVVQGQGMLSSPPSRVKASGLYGLLQSVLL